ncbi:N-methyl-L-tryptophan oxidase [Isoptericola halotolerans]|uniref:Sarcosine oxidase n=1 Tax=Isoptericola halotolerans TaxID=300560 RepID=A0ABX2A9N4_9MICO|nr:sarcosine oxidase [Isoptericola halotolerans]
MSRAPVRVVVVGLGAWGAHVAWRLARRGADVVGLDRHAPPHGFGSSGGATRMFRTACLEHPDLVEVARRSDELWRGLADRSGRRLRVSDGGMLLGPPDGPVVSGARLAARLHGLPVEVLEAADVRRRYPGHATLPDGHLAVVEPEAALLDVDQVIRGALEQARDAGARLRTGVTVRRAERRAGGVRVEWSGHGPDDGGTIDADVLVLAAGVGNAGLLPDLAPGLVQAAGWRTVVMPMTFLRVDDPAGLGVDDLPVFMRELDDGRVLWGHGVLPGADPTVVKLGVEAATPLPPDGEVRPLAPQDWAPVLERAPVAFPGVRAEGVTGAACPYDRTRDGQFVIGPVDDGRQVWVAGGCNAHGFKHSAGIGEAVAEGIVEGRTSLPVGAFAPDRFAGTGAHAVVGG